MTSVPVASDRLMKLDCGRREREILEESFKVASENNSSGQAIDFFVDLNVIC